MMISEFVRSSAMMLRIVDSEAVEPISSGWVALPFAGRADVSR